MRIIYVNVFLKGSLNGNFLLSAKSGVCKTINPTNQTGNRKYEMTEKRRKHETHRNEAIIHAKMV